MAEALQPVSSVPTSPQRLPEREGLAFAARGFEGLLLYQLLRSAQQPVFSHDEEESESLPGFGQGDFAELTLLSFADFLAQSGQGVGIARWLYRTWTGEELPSRSSVLPVTPPVPQGHHSPSPAERSPEPALPTVGQVMAALRPYRDWIRQAAEQTGLPPTLLAAVIWVESAGNPRAVSPAGAQGLMQLMPATAQMLGVSDPFDPRENVLAGSRYLEQLWRRFGELPLALAAYNAGPGRVERYGGIPPFAETRAYVRRVLELYRRLEDAATEAPASL